MHFTSPSLKACCPTACSSACCCCGPKGLFSRKCPMSRAKIPPTAGARPARARPLHRLGLAVPHWGSEFIASLALTCLMYVALSTSWALFCGTTRYLSLATSAFFGLGAYTSAIVARHVGWVPTILLGGAVSAVVAVRDGRGRAAPARHLLRGAHLRHDGADPPCRHLLREERDRHGRPRAHRGAFERDTIYSRCWRWRCGVAVATACWSSAALRPGAGRHRCDEQRAQTLGVDTRWVKIMGFALTAAFAGAVGAAMSVRWTYIDPPPCSAPSSASRPC
jgi:branched-chain amino acid transport system permease protein